MGERPGRGDFLSLIEGLDDRQQAMLLRALNLPEAWGADIDWASWAHEGQEEPAGRWAVWVIMGGRGYGKTRAGAEAVLARAKHEPVAIALVGATIDEARRVMVEGPSGLLTIAEPWITRWSPTNRELHFSSGAVATLFSGASPEALRGPEHHFAWCDELAKWEKGQESWDMLQLGLRKGEHPQALITTTPRPGPLLSGIMAQPDTIVTGGPTRGNPHLPDAYLRRVHALYAGTRMERQELHGELLTDAPGALWTEALLEECRVDPPRNGEGDRVAKPRGGGVASDSEPGDAPTPPPACGWSPSPFRGGFTRIVIGVDPPSGDGTCGIVACAKDGEGLGHVLADHSVTACSPESWARAVADAARIWSENPPRNGEVAARSADGGVPRPNTCAGGDAGPLHHPASPAGPPPRAGEDFALPILIVAEINQGGRMVESVLRAADAGLRIKPVHAAQGKAARADPIATLFEAGKIILHGRFPELEAELCGLIAGGGYQQAFAAGRGGGDRSPDRADAMVWALTELMLGKERPRRIVGF